MQRNSSKETIKIGVGQDALCWHSRFIEALELQSERRKERFTYDLVNLDAHDWLNSAHKFDAIIWKSFCLGPEATSHMKEKIYFLSKYEKKIVLPNFDTIWHYDSKIAQSYIFEFINAPVPKTIISHNLHDVLNIIKSIDYPIISKKSWGAGSRNVKMLDNKIEAEREIETIFHQPYWDLNKKSSYLKKLSFISKRWFQMQVINKIILPLSMDIRFPYIYLQEFLKNNKRDLRITVIGDRYVFGFWRNNRENDFRASGSGKLDYETPIPENIIWGLVEINRKMGFDSMAYDIIFDNNSYRITEMSYAYDDKAIYNSRGYYEVIEEKLVFHECHIWPQYLWVEWLLQKLGF